MNYKSKKTNKKNYYDYDDSHHEAKRKKSVVNNKQIKNLDNVLRSKNTEKILTLEERY